MAEQVVGLRFVNEGYDQAVMQVRDYSSALKQNTNQLRSSVNGANAAASAYLKQVAAYNSQAAALNKLNKMQLDSARAAQAIVNSAAGVTNTYKSAASSASVFSTELRKQEAELSRVAKASQEHMRALQVANHANKSAADSASVFERQMEAQAAEALRLESMYNKTAMAARVFEQAQVSLNRALELGVIDATQHKTQLENLQSAYTRVGQNSNRANTFINQFGEHGRVAGIKTNRFGMVAQQVGYQVGDFFVQVQSGTNAFVAFGQQATQLAGLLPGLAGAVVGIGISVGTMFLSMWDRTRQAKEGVQEVKEVLEALKQEVKSLDLEWSKLAFGTDSSARASGLRTLELLTRELAVTQKEYSDAVAEANENEFSVTARGVAGRLSAKLQVLQDEISAIQEQIRLEEESRAQLERAEQIHRGMLAVELGHARAMGDAARETARAADNARGLELAMISTVDAAARLGVALSSVTAASSGRLNQISVLRAQISAAEKGMSVSGAGAAQQAANELIAAGASPDMILGAYNKAFEEGATIERLQETLSKLTTPPRTDGGGGGGGGAAAREQEDYLRSLQDEAEQKLRLVGLTDEQKRYQEILFELGKRGLPIEEERIQKVLATEEALRKATEAEEQRQALMDTVNSNIKSALMDLIQGTQSVEDAFKSMLRNIILAIYEQQIAEPFAKTVGNMLFGGLGLASANGNVFSKGSHITAYANGGVVNGPAIFPMSNGTGLMGEAGPEAIMPLKRTKSGKLGVVAEAGGNVNQTLVFNIAANGDESVKRIVQQEAPRIAEQAKAAVLDAKRRGGSYGGKF